MKKIHIAILLAAVLLVILYVCKNTDHFTSEDLKNLPPPPTGRVRPPSPKPVPLPSAPQNLNFGPTNGPPMELCQQAIDLLPVISSNQRLDMPNDWLVSAINGWCNNAQTRRWQAEAYSFGLGLGDSIRALYDGQSSPDGIFHNKQNVCAAAKVISTPPTGAEQYWDWYWGYYAGYPTDTDAQTKLAEMLSVPECEFTNDDFSS